MFSLNINLFGAAGIGKSLAAARLLVGLRDQGFTAELVTTCATDLAYAGQLNGDTQLDLARVQHGLQTLRQGRAEFVICQTPAALALAYADAADHQQIRDLVRADMGEWASLNVLLNQAVAKEGWRESDQFHHLEVVAPTIREFIGPGLVELDVNAPDFGEALLAQSMMHRRLYERTAVAEMFVV